jgi:hypothetical protein
MRSNVMMALAVAMLAASMAATHNMRRPSRSGRARSVLTTNLVGSVG